MQASDVMTTPVITVTPDTGVRETARRLIEHRISAMPVMDDGRLVGIVSEGDLMRHTDSGAALRPSWWRSLLTGREQQTRSYVKSHARRVADVMTPHVITVEEETPLEEIAERLERQHIKRVPVMRDGRLVGIISRADLLHGLIVHGVSAQTTADDRAIKTAVLDGLKQAGITRRLLNVVVSGGTVHIWGIADTPEETAAIRVAAESAPGVKSVECNVDAPPSTARAVLWPD